MGTTSRRGRDDGESEDRNDESMDRDDGESREHDADLDREVEPITDRTHDNSWSANLEKPHHADDRALVVEQAATAVEHTTAGNHVNLVTHGDHGHPETYLYDALAERFGDAASWEYVEQCGCGGHVTRVHVE